MMGQEAVVIVEGLQQTVAAESIVQGDLVSLKAGDVVPADMRLIENHGLVVEESILTGESEPVKKTEHVITENSIVEIKRTWSSLVHLFKVGQLSVR